MLYDKERWETKVQPVKLEPWQQHLLDAAQYIRKHGWCQNRSRASDGSVCLLGALDLTCSAYPSGTGHHFHYYLVERHGANGVADWNDQPDRTKEQVIAALEDAARGE